MLNSLDLFLQLVFHNVIGDLVTDVITEKALVARGRFILDIGTMERVNDQAK